MFLTVEQVTLPGLDATLTNLNSWRESLGSAFWEGARIQGWSFCPIDHLWSVSCLTSLEICGDSVTKPTVSPQSIFAMYFLFIQPEHCFCLFPDRQKVQGLTWFQSPRQFFTTDVIPTGFDLHQSRVQNLAQHPCFCVSTPLSKAQMQERGWSAANSSTIGLSASARFAIS